MGLVGSTHEDYGHLQGYIKRKEVCFDLEQIWGIFEYFPFLALVGPTWRSCLLLGHVRTYL